jgi:hypothetical protein
MQLIDDIMSRQTKAPQQIAAVAVFLPLALLTVVIRIWIRSRMINSFGWDDVMMVVALVSRHDIHDRDHTHTSQDKFHNVRCGIDGHRGKWWRNPPAKPRPTKDRDQCKLK